jgi:cell division transport system permease protein
MGLTLTVLAAIAVLTLILDGAALRTLDALGPRLNGEATVVVWPHGLESADAAAARAGEIIAAVPGVRAVTPLDPASSDAMFGRLLGGSPGGEQRLLAVQATGDPAGLSVTLGHALAAQGVPARVTDHDWNTSGPARTVAVIAAIGVFIPVVAIVVFAVAGAMAARREIVRAAKVIELMRIVGASDAFLSGLVQRRVAGLALISALWAAAVGLIAVAAAAQTSLAEPLGGLTRGDLLTPWPLIIPCVWLAAAVTAWLAARGALRSRR